MSNLCPKYLVKMSLVSWCVAAISVKPPLSSARLAIARTSSDSFSACSRFMLPISCEGFLVSSSKEMFMTFSWGSMALIRRQSISFKSTLMPGFPEACKLSNDWARVRHLHNMNSMYSDSWVESKLRCNSFLFLFMNCERFAIIYSLCFRIGLRASTASMILM